MKEFVFWGFFFGKANSDPFLTYVFEKTYIHVFGNEHNTSLFHAKIPQRYPGAIISSIPVKFEAIRTSIFDQWKFGNVLKIMPNFFFIEFNIINSIYIK